MKAWAIKWVSDSPLDGHRESLIGAAGVAKPVELSGCNKLLFASRKLAREYIKRRYGYIATRPDLRSTVHSWKMPRAVRVNIQITEASTAAAARRAAAG